MGVEGGRAQAYPCPRMGDGQLHSGKLNPAQGTKMNIQERMMEKTLHHYVTVPAFALWANAPSSGQGAIVDP